jgi:hypothetical protein
VNCLGGLSDIRGRGVIVGELSRRNFVRVSGARPPSFSAMSKCEPAPRGQAERVQAAGAALETAMLAARRFDTAARNQYPPHACPLFRNHF